MAQDKALSLNNGLPAIKNWIKEKFVVKVEGKQLSTNDYTTEEKNKLAGLNGGEVNVQADWEVVDAQSDAFIKNKPTSMPADGGNAATVGGCTVGVNVPAGAKFTDTTYDAFIGATASAAGGKGLVPSPAVGGQAKFLKGDGTWQTPPNTTYEPVTQVANGLMIGADKKKLDGFQDAGEYALKTELASVYRYQHSVATEAELPTTGLIAGYVYSIEAKSSYGPAGTNVAWTKDGEWDNLGGNFVIDYATASEVLAVLNA